MLHKRTEVNEVKERKGQKGEKGEKRRALEGCVAMRITPSSSCTNEFRSEALVDFVPSRLTFLLRAFKTSSPLRNFTFFRSSSRYSRRLRIFNQQAELTRANFEAILSERDTRINGNGGNICETREYIAHIWIPRFFTVSSLHSHADVTYAKTWFPCVSVCVR